MHRILIVEDEAPMRTALADCLQSEGYRVITAADGACGLKRALEEKPDLILLDVMMPQLDGFTVAAELRRLKQSTPILMLTAKGMVQDRVAGLDAGADDYLVKPFSLDELLARVRAILRRLQVNKKPLGTIDLDEVKVDFPRQEAWRKGDRIRFTAKEFAMLRLLVEAEGQPISREQFLDLVWEYAAFPTTRTVDNHVASLRQKIEQDPAHPRWIKTVHGVGYKLELPPEFTKP